MIEAVSPPPAARGAIQVCVSALLERDGRYLALRRSALAVKRPGEWEIPGGTAEFGEDPGDAIVREVSEETGLKAENAEVAGLASEVVTDDGAVCHRVEVIFLARDLRGEVKLSDEHEVFDWVTVDELPPTIPEGVRQRLKSMLATGER